ncbi:MAG TPA: outer membrane protein assembly factor BamA [Dissulfurispiraceae bacterium]|nr:outer membrane protein assembly factor BamA [Dissulfurispiraceae bacterium]
MKKTGINNSYSRIMINAIFWLIVVCLLLLSISVVSAAETELSAVPVRDIEISGLYSISQKELLYLLDIKKGEPLDGNKLRRGIKRAFLKGIFSDIVVRSTDAGWNSITINVKEKMKISAISVHGQQHFSERFIVRNFNAKKGERLNERKIENAVSALEELIKSKGFPGCKISFLMGEAGKGKVKIDLSVEEGAPLLIKEIDISGGTRDDRDVLSRRLGLKPGDSMDRTILQQATEKSLSDFKKKNYVGTAISDTFMDGMLSLIIQPGSKLNIKFEGNSSVSSSALRKELPFFELDEYSDDILDETVLRILALYHHEGFPEAQVAPIVNNTDKGLNIKFYIHEGERYKVGKISFEGSSISADKLKGIIQLQKGDLYDPDLVTSDNENIQDFYHSLGYLYVSTTEPEVVLNDGKASIVFSINEGMQVRVKSIDVKNNNIIHTDEILKNIPLKTNNPYNDVDILDSRIRIQNLYRNKGYLDAGVTIDREISGDSATVLFTVHEGSEYYFGKNIVIGNEDTKREVITRALLHKEEDPFNYSLLLGERQRLYRTGLFKDVEAVAWGTDDHVRDVLYRVEEENAGAVEFGFGYGEFEKFRGFLDITYKNLFGMNRQITFRTEMSTLTRRFILQYFEPLVFGHDLAFKAQFLREYKKEMNFDTGDINYRLNRYSATAGVEKKLTDKIKGELYFVLDNVKTYDVKPDIILTREDTGSLLISGVKTGLIYDSRDNPVNPRSGTLAGITYKIATAMLLSETDFNKIQMYANKYVGLGKHVVVAVSLRGGAAKGFSGTSELPLVERFFLGGRTTVRGYAQDTLGPKGTDNNPTGGNAFLMGNMEFRFDVWKGFGLVTFLDWGNVWQKTEQVTFNDIKYTTGLGLRYNTPVGPLSVDYGYKLNRRTGESKGEIHFSVGQSF